MPKAKPISLYPLSFEEAIKALLKSSSKIETAPAVKKAKKTKT